MKPLALIPLVILFGCGGKKEKLPKEVYIFGTDTIVYDNGNTDLTKCRAAEGWVDTLTNTWYTKITPIPDTITVPIDISLQENKSHIPE